MKVLLLNGSPHAHGSVYTALEEIAGTLEADGVGAEIFQMGNAPIRGCQACAKCRRDGCNFEDDPVNALLEALKNADGFIVGSPVYYASANGSLISMLDRLFYSGARYLVNKPSAAIACARRAGTTATLDELNKYFTINRMPVVSSTYWNMVHGNSPEEVRRDAEGLQIMRNLAHNMAWLIKCIDCARNNGITPPVAEKGEYTNFIR